MIQNPGVCPIEGYTVLGVSTTRTSQTSGTIGQFGSGSKHSTNLLLRHNISPIVFCANLRLDFDTIVKKVYDGLENGEYGQVVVHMSGKDADGKQVKRKQELSFSIEFGTQDWDNISMALREYVSNAIDRTIRQEGDFREALQEERLCVKFVQDNQVRAKSDYTRVFVPVSPYVEEFHDTLHKRFLHFREPDSLNKKILPKRNRGIINPQSVMLYKNGVLVCEISGSKSVFDYNFGTELKLDESRNIEQHQARTYAAQALRDADPNSIKQAFQSILKQEDVWEASFSKWDLSLENIYNSEQKKAAKENWHKGFDMAVGDAVICKDAATANLIQRKGLKVQLVENDAVYRTLDQIETLKTAEKILSHFEKNGIEIIDANKYALEAVDIVWQWVVDAKLTQGKDKPPVFGFIDIMKAEGETQGFYRDGKVYLNQYFSEGGVNHQLLGTAIEEVCHYITGSGDNSRDFQNFFIQMLVTLMENKK